MPYFPNFLPFLPIFWPLFSNFCPILRIGRTVWHKSMAHQLGRTELEKLAPPERILFWQNRIEFWQKEMVGPPSKMPQERLWAASQIRGDFPDFSFPNIDYRTLLKRLPEADMGPWSWHGLPELNKTGRGQGIFPGLCRCWAKFCWKLEARHQTW